MKILTDAGKLQVRTDKALDDGLGSATVAMTTPSDVSFPNMVCDGWVGTTMFERGGDPNDRSHDLQTMMLRG